jgi:hypothetical protein
MSEVSPEVAQVLSQIESTYSTDQASKTLAETGAFLDVISQQVAHQAELATSVLDTVTSSTVLVDKARDNFTQAIQRSSNSNLYLTLWFLFVGVLLGVLDVLF